MILSQHLTRTIIMHLPFLVIYIVVLVIAGLRRKNIPSVSALVIVAMVTLILASLVSLAFAGFPVLYQWVRQPSILGVVVGLGDLISGIVAAAGWVLLLAAVFLARKKPASVEASTVES